MSSLRPRLRVRTLLALVALCACADAAWIFWSPRERWRRDIRDPDRSYEAIELATAGRVWGISDDLAVTELASALGDLDPTVRYHAAGGLAGFGVRAEAAAPTLIAAVRDPDVRVRGQAIFSLLERQVAPPNTVAREQAVVAAIHALADEDALVRIVAAQSLASVGHGEEALPALLRALRDDDLKIHSRKRALWSLGHMGPKAAGAIPALREVIQGARLDDPYARLMRVEAASVLARLGAVRGVLPILQDAMRDNDVGIRQTARSALSRYMNEDDPREVPE